MGANVLNLFFTTILTSMFFSDASSVVWTLIDNGKSTNQISCNCGKIAVSAFVGALPSRGLLVRGLLILLAQEVSVIMIAFLREGGGVLNKV